jgi:hypothetical protein
MRLCSWNTWMKDSMTRQHAVLKRDSAHGKRLLLLDESTDEIIEASLERLQKCFSKSRNTAENKQVRDLMMELHAANRLRLGPRARMLPTVPEAMKLWG